MVNKKLFALGRMKAGQMNKTESMYSAYLNTRVFDGSVAWFKFEGMKFKLADNTFFTPDFNVMLTNGELQMHEVKGFWMDDARVKIKVAAELYPMKFFGVTAKSKKDGGGWKFELFGGPHD